MIHGIGIYASNGGGGEGGGAVPYSTKDSFPLVGVDGTIYEALDTHILYVWDSVNSVYIQCSEAGEQISVTFEQLQIAMSASTLVAGAFYKITNYRTTHLIQNTDTVNIGIVEPIIVLAVKNNQVSKQAWSSLYLQDSLVYDVTNTIVENGIDTRTGLITYRRDCDKNIEAYYDWRAYKFRRYALDASMAWNGTLYDYIENDIVYDGDVIYVCISNIASSGTPTIPSLDLVHWMPIINYTTKTLFLINGRIGSKVLTLDLATYVDYVTFNGNASDVVMATDCYNFVFYGEAHQLSFGSSCYSNSFYGYTSNSQFGQFCAYMIFEGICTGNSFKDSNNNILLNNSISNSFGSVCHYIILPSGSSYNTFADNIVLRTFTTAITESVIGFKNIDAGDTKLTMLADGLNPQDAVNVRQLKAIGGTNFSRTIFIDSVNGVDENLNIQRGQATYPYKTIPYVLTKIDDGTIVTKRTITASTTITSNTLTSVSDTTNVEVGQYLTGLGIPYNTVVVSKTVDTIVLSKNATASNVGIVATIWYNTEVCCQGSFAVTANINRNAITFSTTSFAKLSATSSVIMTYTDTNNYLIPCQTLKGNWSILMSGSAQLITYMFSTDIAVTDVAYHFFDEWNVMFSTVTGGTSTTSSIVNGNPLVYNRVKIGLSYNSSIAVNGLFFYSSCGYGQSLTVFQKYTYGYLGGFQDNKNGINAYTFSYIDIPHGIIESQIGVHAMYFYGEGTIATIGAKIIGDLTLIASTITFTGDVLNANNILFGQGRSWAGNQISCSGNLYGVTITLYGGVYSGIVSAYSYINFPPMEYVSNVTLCNYNGLLYCTGGNVVVTGQSSTGSLAFAVIDGVLELNSGNYRNYDSAGGSISGGVLKLNGFLATSSSGVTISGSGVVYTGQDFVGYCSTYAVNGFFKLNGGKLFHSGRLRSGTSTLPCLSKTAGKLVVDGGKFLTPSGDTNPIKITVDSSEARQIFVLSAYSNCDGTSTSILNTFDATGTTFEPILMIGGNIIEDLNVE